MEKSSGFRFWDAVKAGFLATAVLTAIMAFFGTNCLKVSGEMLLSGEASTLKLYAAGGALIGGIGIVYGLLYALILAPIAAFNALVKAIIFSALITAVTFYGKPKMPEVIGKIKGEEVKVEAFATEQVKEKDPCEDAPNIKLAKSWLNHFVFALMIAALYRRRKF